MDLFDYIRACRKRMGLIIGGVVLCVAAAVVISLVLPEKYEAQATLTVEESLLPSPGDSPYANPRALELVMATYENLVNSRETMQRAVDKFGLDEEPYGLDWRSFQKGWVSVDQVRGSRLITISCETADPKLGEKIANFIAESAIERARNISTSSIRSSRSLLKERVGEAHKELKNAERELRQFREQSKLPVLRKELNILLGRKKSLQDQILSVRGGMENKRQTLSQVAQSLGKQDSIIDLQRSLAKDALYQQLMAGINDEKQQDLLSLSMVNQVQNPVYVHLQQRKVNLESDLSGLEAKLAFLKKERKDNEQKLLKMQKQLVSLELERQEKERVYGLKRASYKDLSRRYDDISVEIASSTPALKMADRALVPPAPSSPNRKLIVAGTGFASLFVFLFLAAFMEFLEMEWTRRKDGTERS